MTGRPGLDASPMPAAQAAALLFALDPHGFGGVTLRCPAGPVRDRWLGRLRSLMPAEAPWRRLPAGTAEARLDGGLDLAATLALGRPVLERGLLGDSDGGTVVIPMAERLPEPAAARLAAALDTGLATDRSPAQFGLVALDEGIDEDTVSARLQDRLAFWTDLSDDDPGRPWPDAVEALTDARRRLPRVLAGDEAVRALAETGAELGVASIRAVILAVRAARGAAALAGRDAVAPEDAAVAARLVLAPRATQVPVSRDDAQNNPEHGKNEGEAAPPPDPGDTDMAAREAALSDLVLSAAKSALPSGLLLKLQAAAGRTARQTPGRSGATQASPKRGRPAGLRRGRPQGGARLSIIETLRAAAPFQGVRRTESPDGPGPGERLRIRRDDFRFTRFKQRTETVTVFAVDASGSLAMNRLAEAKGAVELLLAECYVRRDQVALIAFRGAGAELLLPPTRSLARAKRSLAELAGGGATPLAAGIEAALATADQIRRQGRTPVVVFLTDGRANTARDGTVGRAAAEADAQAAALLARASGVRILVVDAAPRPQPPARALAATMNATYVPLPRVEAKSLTAAIRTLTVA